MTTTDRRPQTADDGQPTTSGGRPSAVGGQNPAVTFLGDWLVSEYVYTPAGEYVGVVRQRRRLQPLAEGKIRVIQLCELVETAVTNLSANAAQAATMMNKRVGEFVFDLHLAGQARHYLGPDVIGGGFSWQDGALTARGLWPRLGYNFTSFSILLNPERQVTGGKFFIANEEIATIVGAAVPEAQGYPEMTADGRPLTARSLTADGRPPTARSLTADGRPPTAMNPDDYRGHRYFIAPDGKLLEIMGIDDYGRIAQEIDAAPGREKWYGPLREVEAVTGPGETLSLIEIHDPAARAIAGLGKRFQDEKLRQVELFILTADRRRQTAEDDLSTNSGGRRSAVGGQISSDQGSVQ